MSGAAILFLELAQEHADQQGVLQAAATSLTVAGAEVLAHAAPGKVACLEPGSVAAGLLLARFANAGRLEPAAQSLLTQLQSSLPHGAVPTLYTVDALPEQGLPDALEVPTAASVRRPPATPRNAFLVIRGTGWDAERLTAYRNVILPMHHERGGLYEVFALDPSQVRVISGAWTEQIFAISRWPRREVAEDFWFCDRYQKEAIPLRLGAGRFSVHLLDAATP